MVTSYNVYSISYAIMCIVYPRSSPRDRLVGEASRHEISVHRGQDQGAEA